MSAQTLSTFFKNKRSKADPSSVDYASRRDQWIADVDQLYEDVTAGLLKEAVADGLISTSLRDAQLNEDRLGSYAVRELLVRVGEESVLFSPKGRDVVGAQGRVDIVGDLGVATLVLQPGGRWALVAQRSPTLRLVPLDKQSLLDALVGIMRP